MKITAGSFLAQSIIAAKFVHFYDMMSGR